MNVRDYLIWRSFFTVITLIAIAMVSVMVMTLLGDDLLRRQLK